MNIAAFVASSSRNGNTATAVKTLTRQAEKEGASCKIFYLNEYFIKPCIGCRVCEETDKCFQKDDVEIFHEAIRWAHAYVFATPTYYGDITGQFKQFIDRLYPFIDIYKDPETRTMRFGSIIKQRKPGILVACSGSHGGSIFSSHSKVAFHGLNDINGYLWKQVLIPGTTWTKVADMPEALAELRESGSMLVEHLRQHAGEDTALTERYRKQFS